MRPGFLDKKKKIFTFRKNGFSVLQDQSAGMTLDIRTSQMMKILNHNKTFREDLYTRISLYALLTCVAAVCNHLATSKRRANIHFQHQPSSFISFVKRAHFQIFVTAYFTNKREKALVTSGSVS